MTTQTQVLQNALRDFRRSVEITRDVRFQANLRLARRQRWSSYMVSSLSLYVIALSLLPNILQLRPFQTQLLLACSIVLSVFVIFTSLIDGSQNFYHRGELLHACGRRVATVHHELKMVDVDADPERAAERLQELRVRYQSALDECPINHDNSDFYAEKASKPQLFSNEFTDNWRWLFVAYYRTRSVVQGHSWVSVHIIALLGVSWIVYAFILADADPIH